LFACVVMCVVSVQASNLHQVLLSRIGGVPNPAKCGVVDPCPITTAPCCIDTATSLAVCCTTVGAQANWQCCGATGLVCCNPATQYCDPTALTCTDKPTQPPTTVKPDGCTLAGKKCIAPKPCCGKKCCPIDNGICCSNSAGAPLDGVCCPAGAFCSASGGCVVDPCTDSGVPCTTGSVCCGTTASHFCCPIANGICCGSSGACCPQGTQCASGTSSGGCKATRSDGTFEIIPMTWYNQTTSR